MFWQIVSALLAVSSIEDEGIRRIQAHLLIEDPHSALVDAEALASECPDSSEIQKILIEALAANGLEEEALKAWNRLTLKRPELLYERHLLEELAWGVLKKGTSSTQYGVR